MRCRFFTLASALSLLVSVGVGVLWARGWRDHLRVGYFDGEGRYTLHSAGGRLFVAAPPLPDRDDAYVHGLALQMSNDDIQLSIVHPVGESTMCLGIGGDTATAKLNEFLFTTIQRPVAERSLLSALEKPQ